MPPSAKAIRVLVVDDEPPARQRLIEILRQDPDVHEILEADNGSTAIRAIESGKPDLVFLDINMPEHSGLDVIRRFASAPPMIVFVTAHDQYAIRAFEDNALDYLLKPFSDERLEACMARAKQQLGHRHLRELGETVLSVLGAQAPPAARRDRFVVKTGPVTDIIGAHEIEWIEGTGVYVTLHARGKQYLYRAALQEVEHALDPARFLRVHRSAIVNIDSILRLEHISHGEFRLQLKGGAGPRVSRTYRHVLEQRLGGIL